MISNPRGVVLASPYVNEEINAGVHADAHPRVRGRDGGSDKATTVSYTAGARTPATRLFTSRLIVTIGTYSCTNEAANIEHGHVHSRALGQTWLYIMREHSREPATSDSGSVLAVLPT